MASVFAHAVAGAALWPLLRSESHPRRAWLVGAALAVLPDIDYVGYRLGIPYDAPLGHRGLTHSIAFAVAMSILVLVWLYPASRWPDDRGRLGAYLVCAALTHGLLDAMTTGGLGVAFFAPLANERFFFPFRPIAVSPLSISRFFAARGAAILLNEAVWVGLPAAVLALTGRWLHRPAQRRQEART